MGKEKIHVLLIEDEPDNFVLNRSLLEGMKTFHVVLDRASNFEEGIRKTRQCEHDLILVAYRAGNYNASELVKSANNQCAAPLILLTGNENYEIEAAAKAGAADYLIESQLDAPLLERSIRYAMERNRIEIAWRSALQENNRMAAAITNLPIGVVITDTLQADNPIVFVNPAFTQITGYSMMEVTGRNCRLLQGPDTDPKAIAKIRNCIASSRPFQGQILNYRKDGTPFWNDLRLQPIYQDGRVTSYTGLLHDITSRVEAEQSNRDLVVDLGERVKEMSALHAVARILQEEIDPSELLQNLVAQIPPAFQFPNRIAARLTLAQREYSTAGFQPDKDCLEARTILSDGSRVILEAVYQPNAQKAQPPFIEEERSLLQSVVEMVCSRWERDLARNDLQAAHAQLEERVARRTLQLETRTSELHNSENRLRKINREILELSRLKFPADASLGSVLGAYNEAAVRSMDIERASAWIYNETREALQCIDYFDKRTAEHDSGAEAKIGELPHTFTALETERTLAIIDVASDPRIADFYHDYLQPLGIGSLLIAPILKDGIIIGILSLARMDALRPWTLEDQTYAGSLADLIALELETLELQKTQESLRLATLEAKEARIAAERANRAKSEFLSRMSHELRTPLNSILGFGQLLQRDQLSEKHQERVGLIVTAGQHLLALINEVLDIARVESGRLSLSIEPVQLSSVVAEAISLIAPLAARRNIALKNQAHLEDTFALADRQKLHQVMLNLLSNAVKYNQENGEVRVWCEESANNQLHLSVANTGRGIAPGNLERAFIPFERLDAEHSDTEGTGLGLALVKRLVEAMGGTIGAGSTPDGETVFTLTLPVGHNPLTTPSPVLQKFQHLLPTEEFRILYIEDNLANLKLIESIFNDKPNVRLMKAMQGGLGIELAREHQPDLILLDLHLPDIEGAEVLQRLQSDPATCEIPVIMLSADATENRRLQMRALGAQYYLTKPLNMEEFLTAVHEIVENRENSVTMRFQ